MARIVWITERHLPDSGGMAVSSTRLVNALRDRGHSLAVLHLAAGRGEPFRLLESEGHWRAEGWRDNAERLFFLLRRRLEGSVLVGFGGGMPGYLASLWGRWLKSASVAMFRGNDLDRLSHDPHRGWMVHQTLRMADLACAVSTEMAARIVTLRKGPVLFSPLGINPEEWHAFPGDHEMAAELRTRHAPDKRPLVGIFGQLKFKKGLRTAIDVFREYGLGRRARLLTVGDLPQEEQAELAESCAEFWSAEPFVARDRLLPYYLACDVVLIPSLYDGMPNVLMEAMVCGSVVVASRAGGMPDVISPEEDGFLFEPGDSVAAGETLADVLALAPHELQRIGSAAHTTISTRFTGSQETDILEAAFRNVSGG
jgi:glycogen(starch) synthase